MKQLIILILCLSGGNWLIAQEKGALTIKVSDIKANSKGEVFFMLFDQEGGFPREKVKALKVGSTRNFNAEAKYTFNALAHGTYAVAVFLDKNGNKKLDANFMGFPKEKVGASNMTKLGKPKFDKCTFQFNEQEQEVVIRFIN